MTLDNSLLEVSLTEENGSSSLIAQQVAAAPKTVFDRLQQGRKVTHNVKAGLFGTAIENDEDDDDDGQEEYEQQQVVTYAHHGEYVQQDEDENDGQVQFAVTMNKHQHSSSTKVVQPYRQVVYHDNRNNNSGTYNGRGNQPYTHNGGNNRPNNNNNNNKRINSNNNRSVKGATKQVVSSVDLDNDLDSYFAAK